MANGTIDLGHDPNAQEGTLKRQREGFDPRAHREATKDVPKWSDLTPEQQKEFEANLRRQVATNASQVNRDSRSVPQEINLNFEDLQALAQRAGFILVAIGDKPPSDDGYSLNREARIKELEAQVIKMHERATTAESTAASAISEVNELKAAKEHRK